MKKWLIVYSSVTGNTKQIAEAIYDGFGENVADIFAIRDEFNLEDYDNIAVGYWLTRGEPDKMVQELLKKLNNKTVILFQTQGAELNSEHSITAFARAASYLSSKHSPTSFSSLSAIAFFSVPTTFFNSPYPSQFDKLAGSSFVVTPI